ncbi:MAG: preprotein translocase subunit YajC [Holosporaceae bacterium]|jgi:preprotein translocase subunit YajC|nr:preprotein translocase subunit YajC [Holosporaceae bacterium]
MTNSQTATTTPSPPITNNQQQHGIVGSLVPFVLIILVLYFLMFRPQQKHEAKRRSLMATLKKGDKVVTSSGIIGILHKIINEKEVSLEISENVRVRMLKSSIAEVLEKNSQLEKEDDKTTTASTTSKSAGKKHVPAKNKTGVPS